MKLRTKLLLSFLFSSVAPLLAVSYYTLGEVEAGFQGKEKQILHSARHDRETTVINYYDHIISQINEVADSSLAIEAVQAFQRLLMG